MSKRTKRVLWIVPALLVIAVAIPASVQASATIRPGPLFAVALGTNEVGGGDSDARGAFNAIIDGTQFCFGLTVTNTDGPVGAHIHRGKKGVNGPIVIGLTPPSGGDPGTSSACVTAASDVLAEILEKPHAFYVNVHTAAFPGGALRGQLTRDTH